MSEGTATTDEPQTGDSLNEWLDAACNDERFIVERTIKETEREITQLVRYANGPSGNMFVRKIFSSRESGAAYSRISQAQGEGSRFSHLPYIVEFSQSDEKSEVVMEQVPGDTLLEYVKREGPNAQLAVEIGALLCDAATELHEMPGGQVIHRDIKPSNVIVNGRNLVLIDLGIARQPREGAERDTQCYGTPGYAPPEQFGYGQTTVRSDVFAIGMVIAFCLTGTDPDDSLRAGGFDDPHIPPAFRGILERATALDPIGRYDSARELKSALEGATAEPAGSAGMAKAPGTRKRKRTSAIAAPLAAIIAVALAVLAIATLLSPSESDRGDSGETKSGGSASSGAASIYSNSPASTTASSESSSARTNADNSSSAETYQAVFDDYSARLEEAAPRLVEKYKTEAAAVSGDASDLATLCYKKIDELASIEIEGTQKMADLMVDDGDSAEYEQWSQKLLDVYEEQAQLITDAYMDSVL